MWRSQARTLLLLKTLSQRSSAENKGQNFQVSEELIMYLYQKSTVPKTWRCLVQYPCSELPSGAIHWSGYSGLSLARSWSLHNLFGKPAPMLHCPTLQLVTQYLPRYGNCLHKLHKVSSRYKGKT